MTLFQVLDLTLGLSHFASAAHTIVVQTTPEPIKGKLADTFAAASKCMDAAHRLVAKGKQVNI